MEELNRQTVATIGTSLVEIAPDIWQNDRVQIVLTNTSTGGQIISIGIDSEAVSGEGIVLSAGGFYSESEDSGFKPTKKRFTAISSAVGGTLAIQERVRVRN